MRTELQPHGNTGKKGKDAVPARNEFRHFLNHFWNTLDFPQHTEMSDIEPKIEVAENNDAVTVSAELPGIDAKDIDLQISSDGYLTISGEKKNTTEHKDNGNYFSEIYYGQVKRTIPLPWNLDYDRADAKYSEGVVTIDIPKTQIEKAKVKKINVKHK